MPDQQTRLIPLIGRNHEDSQNRLMIGGPSQSYKEKKNSLK